MYVVGIDVGGTFTDCVILSADGTVVADKSPTTPESTAKGMIAALSNAAELLGTDLDGIFGKLEVLNVGTTSLTNRLVTRSGAKVGLLTTKGHEDAIVVGRVMAKTAGLTESEKTDILAWSKPEPIVARPLIRGISERVDYQGRVLASIDEREVREALEFFRQEGVVSVAVCLLWSFRNPAHERAVQAITAQMMPDCYVSLSSEVAPVLGEYERANATVLSAFLGPVAHTEMAGMRAQLEQQGLRHPFFVMGSNGGCLLDREVASRPLDIVSSGPVGGVVAAANFGKVLGYENIIVTDMGGTSFEVGIITDSSAHLASGGVYNRFRVSKPHVDVTSIGAGGGSIAWVDKDTGILKVGPASAGAVPGPVCYANAGVDPTVTDADVVLGRMDPASFFSGRKALDADGARAALEERVARPLGLDLERAAAGVLSIVDARMGDLIRKLTVERGLDPKDFVLFAYGGAGPTHVGSYAREAGVATAVVPLHAATFSALGVASADVVRSYYKSDPMVSPFDPARVRDNLESLKDAARRDHELTGTGSRDMTLSSLVDMRFRHQVHQVRVPLPAELAAQMDDARLIQTFIGMYERAFGAGTAVVEAGVEILTFHLEARTEHVEVDITKSKAPGKDSTDALVGQRRVFFSGQFHDTPVYEYQEMRHGDEVAGPAIIEAGNTTVVVHPDQTATIDLLGNIVMAL